jgi:hypothetical protein
MLRGKFIQFVNVSIAVGWCAKAVCFCALALSLPLSCFALRINNPKIEVQLDKGKSYSGSITVENNSDKDARIRVYAEDFLYVQPFDGGKEFFPLGTTSFSLSSWLVLPPTDFILSPYGQKTVNFILRPQDDVAKVHCGVIFFETAIGKTINEQGQGIDILGRVGSLIFIEPQSMHKAGEFSEITPGPNSLTGNFLNNGNTFLHVQGTYYIIDAAEIVKDRGAIGELYLLPQDKAKVVIKLPKTISAGKFTLVITFDLEEGVAVVKEIDLEVLANGEINILAVRD